MTDAPAPSLDTLARRRAFLAAWAGICVFLLLQTTANALSEQRDIPHLRPLEPFVWEYTSALVAMLLAPGIGWLVRLASPDGGRWLRLAAIHLAGSLAYCLLHVGGFVAIRKMIYAAAGAHYGGADLVYEYRKDAVAYVGFALIFWLADWAARQWAKGREPASHGGGPRLYQMRDGPRVVRVPLEEILAVTSARNYVEFHLAGGRKPLVRETLAKVEEELAGAGFLRTHRSWLVNPAHVRAITPAAAGDFRLELDGGMTAPLSRRFREALDTLRTPA